MERCRLSSLMSPPYVRDNQISKNRKSYISTTQCKIKFTYACHCVSENLTPCRMLKTSFMIPQIIGWNNSFQNMYDML